MTTAEEVAEVFSESLEIIERKNHDYGDSWRGLLWIYYEEDIRTRVDRLRMLYNLEVQGEKAICAEGIESEFLDIINMAAFGLLIYREAHPPVYEGVGVEEIHISRKSLYEGINELRKRDGMPELDTETGAIRE